MNKNTILAVLIMIFFSNNAYSVLVDIQVLQDAAINRNTPDTNQNESGFGGFNDRLLVSSTNTTTLDESIFGFDLTLLPSQAVINSITFNTHRIFSSIHSFDSNPVHIALGNTDIWDANTVTWNTSNGDHGDILDTQIFSQDSTPVWVSWDVSNIQQQEYQDQLLSFYLFTEPLGGSFGHNDQFEIDTAFLTIDYDVAAVPLPAAIWLFISGILSLSAFNFRKN